MKLKRAFTAFAIATLAILTLLLPAFYTDPPPPPLAGPELSSLDYMEVAFRSGDLGLGGMLFLPDGPGPFPAVVIIHGSGTSRRESKWYLSVAEYLQKRGIAVLLPDKRGSEKSEGSWVGADFGTLARDTLAAVDHIRSQELFPYSGIGLLGMSQGGWIAPVVAARDNDIAFVVSMSGASVTTREQVLHEETHHISRYTWPAVARVLAPFTTRRILKMDHVKPYSDFDPLPYWKKVEAPTFFAFGENDENVPVETSIKILKENLDVGMIKVYPDGGHAIKDPQINRVQDTFLNDLVRFIKESQRG